jgi:hypothetical protein
MGSKTTISQNSQKSAALPARWQKRHFKILKLIELNELNG